MTEIHDEMKSTVKTISPVRREIDIELSAAAAAEVNERVVGEFTAKAKLPGFRPGKAPVAVILQKFGHDIDHEVIDRLLPEALHHALEDNGIRTVGVPSVEDVSYQAGGPLRFKAVVETWPEFDLPPYKKLILKKREAVVTDEDVDQTIKDLRRKHAEYRPVDDRGVKDGYYVAVEIQGRDTQTRRLMPSERVVVLAGNEKNDPAINENISGLRANEEKSFTHVYPADFQRKKFAGKTIEYTLKIQSVKEMVFPEVNDEFAKQIGEFENAEALRAKIREELTTVKAKEAKRETSKDAVQAVLAQATIELPETVVQEEMEAVLKNIASQLPRQGITREAAEAIRLRAREQAELNLREHLVIRKIAQAEGFTVTEDDVDAEIRSIAAANGIPPARALENFKDEEGRESLKGTMLARRTVDFLVAQAIIK